jgi:hypothetical protein
MDYKNTIKETEDKLNVYFQNIDDEVKNSANIVHGIVSKVIDLAKSRISLKSPTITSYSLLISCTDFSPC